MAPLPQRALSWLAALAAATGEDEWATSADVAQALHRTRPRASEATTSAAAANPRSD